ncbi:MAG TPA: phosphatase PAP2 family protein [Pseudonocardiaceae bacterium]|jgi:undecaprenyl-diphosphatase|nr:phosphatase PAP2 family protein [Pseudonocardiaceae bacterium]
MTWNIATFSAVNGLAAHTAWLDPVLAAFALWGGLVLLVLILGIAWWQHRDRYWPALLTGVAAVAALGVNQLVAALWFEPRPFVALHGVTVLLAHPADNSFPSDHAVIAGALAVGTLLFARRWGIVAAVVAILLAFARVYAGMHYPLDVIAGLAIGALVAWVVVGVVGKVIVSRVPARSG